MTFLLACYISWGCNFAPRLDFGREAHKASHTKPPQSGFCSWLRIPRLQLWSHEYAEPAFATAAGRQLAKPHWMHPSFPLISAPYFVSMNSGPAAAMAMTTGGGSQLSKFAARQITKKKHTLALVLAQHQMLSNSSASEVHVSSPLDRCSMHWLTYIAEFLLRCRWHAETSSSHLSIMTFQHDMALSPFQAQTNCISVCSKSSGTRTLSLQAC